MAHKQRSGLRSLGGITCDDAEKNRCKEYIRVRQTVRKVPDANRYERMKHRGREKKGRVSGFRVRGFKK